MKILEKTFEGFMSHWNYYLDESGQSKSTTPHAVFGGFGVDERLEESFIEGFRALYLECFGISYEESMDLKGSELFEWDKIRYFKADSLYSNSKRRDLCSELFSHSPNKKFNRATMPKARAEANIKFVNELILLLELFECRLFCALSPYGARVPLRNSRYILQRGLLYLTPKDDAYTTTLIKELESNVYGHIFDFAYANNIDINFITADETERKDTHLRLNFFEGNHKKYVREKQHMRHINNDNWDQLKLLLPKKFTFTTRKSKESLMVQVADIVIYLINWAYVIPNKVQNNFQQIEKIYSYHTNKEAKYRANFFIQNRVITGFKPQGIYAERSYRAIQQKKEKPQS